jgi:hypothetical protein
MEGREFARQLLEFARCAFAGTIYPPGQLPDSEEVTDGESEGHCGMSFEGIGQLGKMSWIEMSRG